MARKSQNKEIGNHQIDLKEVLEESNRAQRRRHTESIHVLFASAVIGSYFTSPFQNFVSDQNIGFTTNVFVALSILYVILKLSEITLRDTYQPQQFSFIFGFISPLIYVFAVFGYLITILVKIIDLPAYLSQEVVGGIFVVLAATAFMYAIAEFRRFIDIWSYSISSGSNEAERFENLVEQVPSTIENGLKINVTQPSVSAADTRIRPDYLGEDRNGNTVLIEAKTGEITGERASYTVDFINTLLEESLIDVDRILIAYTGSVSQSAQDIFEENGFELIKVNPYDAYGRTGRIFEIIDEWRDTKIS